MRLLEQVFSIRQDNNHIIIKIFGVKIAQKFQNVEISRESLQNKQYMNQVFKRAKSSDVNTSCLNIAFIVPPPIKGSGGHRNIYRAVKYLKEQGHKITVYYTDLLEPADIVKQNVSSWFYDMGDIPFICYEGQLGYHDVAIATWWETAYCLKNNIEKISYPFYFVQDFEPSFSPMSTQYIMAENTYRLGFFHICSGPWCKNFLIKKYNAQAEYFQFPVDKSIYYVKETKNTNSKKIVFFAKPEMPRRCYEIGIQALEILKKRAPEVKIILFGSDKVNSIPFDAEVKGLLPTLEDLANLYRSADLGIVFSTTNPSLVPYEMMHCGLPVVDLDMEGAESKYGGSRDNVFLVNPLPEKMAEELYNIINSPDLLRHVGTNGRLWAEQEFDGEDKMGEVVEQTIIKVIINKENLKQ